MLSNRKEAPTFDELDNMLLGEELLIKRTEEDNQSQVTVVMTAQTGYRGHSLNYRGHNPSYKGHTQTT